ncbi:phospholipase D family protein [Sphingomonas sp. R647]|uniref:phospholipase D family protein n=1 Tax=Sphingomonas sp. R647 TaxID=2875233 RepID=UPI001CD79340|nr:phospholipase D family protein [Sphingomonas sp. R647]MCA1197850.1 phospholipase D family protein [Sphingomonas sp. R647]
MPASKHRAAEAAFLAGENLSDAIGDIMGGAKARCAVAFLGKGADTLLAPASIPTDARIICDISLGGTNPKALTALGAPRSARLRCLDGLHAKVYISDRGMIACSANASGGGIGFGVAASLIEAGTLHPAGSAAWVDAASWFEGLWARARQVGKTELSRAAALFSPGAPPARAANPMSLLDAILASPDRFRGVGLVLSAGSTSPPARDEIAAAKIAADAAGPLPLLTRAEKAAIRAWNPGNVFSNWSRVEIDAWPGRFICAHRASTGTFRYYFYERSYVVGLDADVGAVLASRNRTMRASLGLKHGTEAMARTDARRLERLHAGNPRLIETADKLVVELRALSRKR